MSELFAVPAQPRISRASLQAERREVLESVMGALCGDPQDADQLAACGYLLAQVARALTRSGANPASLPANTPVLWLRAREFRYDGSRRGYIWSSAFPQLDRSR